MDYINRRSRRQTPIFFFLRPELRSLKHPPSPLSHLPHVQYITIINTTLISLYALFDNLPLAITPATTAIHHTSKLLRETVTPKTTFSLVFSIYLSAWSYLFGRCKFRTNYYFGSLYVKSVALVCKIALSGLLLWRSWRVWWGCPYTIVDRKVCHNL